MRSKAFPLILGIILLLGNLLSACSSDRQIFPAVSGHTATMAATIVTRTPTFSPPTHTPLPPTQTAAATPSQAPSPSPSPTQTWTPQPTLPPEEAQALVLNLIADNGGCRLPCWWGITPGVTSWEKARSFLETFAIQILTLNENFYGVTIKNLPESISEGAIGANIFVKDDIVQTIRTTIYYPLSEMLQIYGQPNEVWIKVDPQSINPRAPFTIALFYSDKGILATYDGTAKKDRILQICPSDINDYNFWLLWDPSLNLTFDIVGSEASLFVRGKQNWPIFSLEDTANINMDLKIFYETYKDPKNASVCIEFPDPTR